MRITQGAFSFLPDLTDAEIRAQVDYALSRGWACSVEHTDDAHPRNTYWDMWGLPMFDLKDAAGAILYAAEKATQVALDAIQLLGGNGYINDYPTGRLLRDAKLYEIGAGTSEIRRWLIGRELFAETA